MSGPLPMCLRVYAPSAMRDLTHDAQLGILCMRGTPCSEDPCALLFMAAPPIPLDFYSVGNANTQHRTAPDKNVRGKKNSEQLTCPTSSNRGQSCIIVYTTFYMFKEKQL